MPPEMDIILFGQCFKLISGMRLGMEWVSLGVNSPPNIFTFPPNVEKFSILCWPLNWRWK